MTTLNIIKSVCNAIAKSFHTIVEIRDYNEYGWTAIAFMTDNFGGVYANLHVDQKTGVITNWYGSKNAEEVTFENLVEYVADKLIDGARNRDLRAVYEAINAEY